MSTTSSGFSASQAMAALQVIVCMKQNSYRQMVGAIDGNEICAVRLFHPISRLQRSQCG